MTDATLSRRVSERGASHAPEAFRSLLLPLDFSPLSDRVVRRAALLPLANGARLTLLHVVPDSLPARARRRAERDARRALAVERRALAKALPRGVVVEETVSVGVPASEIAARAGAVEAELVVMGRGGGGGLREVFLGSTAERVIRRGQLPVLAVRLPARTRYQRPGLALDLDQGPDEVLGLLLRLIPPPRPRLTIVHAYDVPYRGLVYSGLAEEDAEEYREEYGRKALDELTRRLAAARERSGAQGQEAPSWLIRVRYGDPRSVIRQFVKKERTDLLALATHGYRGIAHAMLGTVAGDVLRQVACDVLVVPPQRENAGTT